MRYLKSQNPNNLPVEFDKIVFAMPYRESVFFPIRFILRGGYELSWVYLSEISRDEELARIHSELAIK